MAKLTDLDLKRRDAILNAALKEFTAKGYDHASTNVISKEAGMAKALMFHYIGSKQELYLMVYDYFAELIEKEYYQKMNYGEIDLFMRLRQSYILQLKLIERYPWITELEKLSCHTNSEELNQEIAKRAPLRNCDESLFVQIDEAKLKNEFDCEMCKQFIRWTCIGFTNQLLDEIRGEKTINSEDILRRLDGYLNELQKIYYVTK